MNGRMIPPYPTDVAPRWIRPVIKVLAIVIGITGCFLERCVLKTRYNTHSFC